MLNSIGSDAWKLKPQTYLNLMMWLTLFAKSQFIESLRKIKETTYDKFFKHWNVCDSITQFNADFLITNIIKFD